MLSEMTAEMLEPMPPCKAALHPALSALSMEALRKVEVLMYLGRDGGDVFSTHRQLPKDNHAATVGVIRAKSPLDEYLAAGLAQAKRDGVDLEASFTKVS